MELLGKVSARLKITPVTAQLALRTMAEMSIMSMAPYQRVNLMRLAIVGMC